MATVWRLLETLVKNENLCFDPWVRLLRPTGVFIVCDFAVIEKIFLKAANKQEPIRKSKSQLLNHWIRTKAWLENVEKDFLAKNSKVFLKKN
jgi:hypothetical protein